MKEKIVVLKTDTTNLLLTEKNFCISINLIRNNIMQFSDIGANIFTFDRKVKEFEITTFKLEYLTDVINNIMFNEIKKYLFYFLMIFAKWHIKLKMLPPNSILWLEWFLTFKKQTQQLVSKLEETIKKYWQQKNHLDAKNFNFLFNYCLTINYELKFFFLKVVEGLEKEKYKHSKNFWPLLKMLKKNFSNYFELILYKREQKTHLFFSSIFNQIEEKDENLHTKITDINEKLKNDNGTVTTTLVDESEKATSAKPEQKEEAVTNYRKTPFYVASMFF